MSFAPTDARLRTLGLGAVLCLAVTAVYWGTLSHGFIWDDDLHVYTNPRIIGPEGLREIWTTAAANYFPLVLTNFWVQHAIWGLAPMGYHAVTIACHALAALLLWRVLVQLRVPGAWLGAALWALHPVQVESVAWISELKNTQSAVFFLLAISFWIRWLEAEPVSDLPSEAGPAARGRSSYAWALACALLAILSKPSTVMLPVALALCAWWMRKRFVWRDVWPLVPFFALAALASGWAIWEQRIHSGALGEEWNQSLLERVAIAGKSGWFYFEKLIWPHPLIFIYPRWATSAGLLDLLPVVGGLVALGVLWWGRERWRPVFIAAVYFVALLFPVLGFFNVFFFRYSFVGDHFQYLASIGPLALAAAVVARWPRWLGVAAAAGVLAIFGVLTVRQGRIYATRITLWRATVADNPLATMAWLNLADSYSKEGLHREAIESFRRGIALRPEDPDGHSDLGCELVLIGRAAEALPEFETALRLRPNSPETHNNLGNALWYLGRREQSLVAYERALALRPGYGEAHNNLGAALAQLGRLDEALPHFAAALRANPKHVEAHDNLGNTFRVLGRLPEAIREHETALRLREKFAEAHNSLALDFVASNRAEEAMTQLRRALELRPDFAAASAELAKLLAAAGREDEALRQLQATVQSAPNSPAAHNNLGSYLAEHGHPAQAVAEYAAAIHLDPRWALVRTNLGAALGALKRWPDAAQQFDAVTRLQPDSADAFGMLGVALVNADRLEEAVPKFERALQLKPQAAELRDQFAQVLRALGRNREAMEQLEKAAELRRMRK